MRSSPTVTPPSLRQRAEEKAHLDDMTEAKPLSLAEAQKLVCELKVHQIELEMQNEELRLKQDELELLLALRKKDAEQTDMYRDFVSLLENTSDFVYFKDENSRFRFCSQTLADITGHSSWRDMIGKHDSEIFPEDTARIYQEEEIPVFRDGIPLLNKTDPFYDSAGIHGWISTNKWPVFDSANRVVGIFGISRGITARRHLEEALQNSNNQLHQLVAEKTSQLTDTLKYLTNSEHFKQTIIDSLPANIVVIDQNGLITAINKPWMQFGHGNDSADETSIAVGADYLASCKTAPALDDTDSETAHTALQGITAVLEGRQTSFVMDYPCHSPTDKRWYQMSVMRPEADFEGAVISHIDISALKQLEEDRCSYIKHLVEAIEQERFRTALELHDDIGQRLTVHSFAISRLKQNQHDKQEGPQILLDMQADVDGMMESLRRICTNLRPALLDELGLSAALKWLVEDFSHHSGIPCSITLNGECCTDNAECAMTIFRIVQESLNNTIKHAAASRADISFCRINGTVSVEISDNGCGITSSKNSVGGSFGIIGMRERAHAIGATLKISSKKGKGTCVKLVIPCKSREGANAVSHC
jgi:PAS domain S-box-containing protein